MSPPNETDLRPQFEAELKCAPELCLATLNERFQVSDWEGSIQGNHVQISVPKADRHLWSPWLNLEVQGTDEGCRLEGRFAPHPGAWTLYLAGFAIFIFSGLGLLMFGMSQWVADQTPTALWGVPVTIVATGLLYGLAFIGQGITSRQMGAMRNFVQEALKVET